MAIDGNENSLDMAALSEKLETINRVVRAAQSANLVNADGTVAAGAIDQLEAAASDQQNVDAKSPAIDELSLDNEETDDNRNKRFGFNDKLLKKNISKMRMQNFLIIITFIFTDF